MSEALVKMLAQATTVAIAYNDILQRMHDVTNQLKAASSDWNIDRVNSLMEARSNLCGKLDQCAKLLDILVPQIRAGIRKSPPSAQQRHPEPVEGCTRANSIPEAYQTTDEFDSIMERAQESLKALLIEQAECETIMSAGLRECEAELTALNQHRELKSTYRTAPHVKSGDLRMEARFLDSRL